MELQDIRQSMEKLSLEMSHIAKQISELQEQYRAREDELIKKIQEAKNV
mgnify:CR=1 FL=1